MRSSTYAEPETSVLNDGGGSSRRLQFLVHGGLALATTLVFWTTDLDLEVASIFFNPDDPADLWPDQWLPLWRFFYFFVPVLTTLLASCSVLALTMGLAVRRFRPLRLPAALMLLTLAVGPGLLINVVSKDTWGRPRPRQVERFEGHMQYVPPLAMGETREGKSLGAGHASVGFSLLAVWLLYRRRRPGLAWVAFGVSMVFGSLMGLGRMAAGAHFLSDVLWSGYVTFLSAWAICHYVLRVPQHEDFDASGTADSSPWWPSLFGHGLMVAVVISGLLAFVPAREELYYSTEDTTSSLPPVLRLELDRADLEIRFTEEHLGAPTVRGNIRGFGFPNYRISSRGRLEERGAPTLVYRLEQNGFFTTLDTRLTLALRPSQLERLEVRLGEGDIRVLHSEERRLPVLDLETRKGRVMSPAATVRTPGQSIEGRTTVRDDGGPMRCSDGPDVLEKLGSLAILLDGARDLGHNQSEQDHTERVADDSTGRRRC